MGTFAGFSDRALELYAGLEADNSREYWARHKPEWEAEVRDPMRALLAGLEDEFGPAKMFRPNRDVRFSKDKAPYKTHQGALVPVSEETVGVGYYVQVDADGPAGRRRLALARHRRDRALPGSRRRARPEAASCSGWWTGSRPTASTSRATGSPRGRAACRPTTPASS